MENASEKMTKEELLDLFSKYDLVELTAMNTVLNYANLESVELYEPDVYVESDLLELDKVRDSLNSIATKNVIKLNLIKKK